MIRNWIAAGVLMAGMVSLTGCGAVSGGETVVKLTHGGTPIMNEAPSDGRYGLYSTYDANKQVEFTLKKGERIGFIERDGQRFAVAGKHEVPVKTTMVARSVYWNRVGD
jgi:hypothetical protein